MRTPELDANAHCKVDTRINAVSRFCTRTEVRVQLFYSATFGSLVLAHRPHALCTVPSEAISIQIV